MMAYPQYGFTACPTAASSLASSQLLSMSAGSTPQTTVSTSCCETGRPIMTDPTTGQTVCSCQYSSAASSLLSYPRVAGLSDSVYSSYAAQGYVPFGADPSAFYSPLNSAYELKEGADAWRSLAHPTPCYPYDPTGMGGYPYGQSALAQRKNATREATSTLKAWLQEHIKNPYPTKGEKIMLAIITKMTLTQVSTWFANARRRLKKENKMTWSPRNRSDEDGNKLDSDDDDDDEKKDEKKDGDKKDKDDDDIDINIDGGDELNICGDDDDDFGLKDADKLKNQCRLAGLPPHSPSMPVLNTSASSAASTSSSCMSTTADPSNPTKPRIWSLADVATSTSPSTGGLHQAPPHQRSNGIHVGPPGGLRGPHPQLPPHHLGSHHPLSASPKSDTSSPFHPAVNGFRPWVNGASSPYANGPNGQTSSQPPAGLLRPYPVAPRTEVH